MSENLLKEIETLKNEKKELLSEIVKLRDKNTAKSFLKYSKSLYAKFVSEKVENEGSELNLDSTNYRLADFNDAVKKLFNIIEESAIDFNLFCNHFELNSEEIVAEISTTKNLSFNHIDSNDNYYDTEILFTHSGNDNNSEIEISIKNLTEYHREIKDLQITNERLITAISDIPQGVILVNSEYKIIYINSLAQSILDTSFEHAQGQEVFDILNLDDLGLQSNLRNAFFNNENKSGSHIFTNTPVMKPSGDYISINGSYTIISEDGMAAGVAIFFDDNAKGIDETTLLKLSEERLNRAQSVANLGSYEVDLLAGAFWISDEAFRIYGIPKTEIDFSLEQTQDLQKRIENVIDSADRGLIETALKELLTDDKKYDLELRLNRESDGERLIVHSRAELIKNEFGFPIKILGTIQDITARKKNDEQILMLSRAVSQSPASTIITDINGVIEYVNPKFTELSGFTSKDVVNHKATLFNLREQNGFSGSNILELAQSGKEWTGELFNYKKSGEGYWELIRVTPVLNDKRELTHLLILGEDITFRKNYEKMLHESKEHAEELSRLKSTILANISHELRTPMNGIMGLAQILRGESADDLHKSMLDNILKSGHRLMNTVNSIIDFSYLESDEIAPEIMTADLSITIEDLLPRLEDLASEKRLSLETDLIPELYADVDENLLQKAISHIYDNAIKFTDLGKISVSTQRELGDDGISYVSIKITDTGIGISKKDQDVIFTEFRQASEGLSRSYEGAGLGLTISKKLIEVMNGSIKIDSVLNFGTTITIKFYESKIPAEFLSFNSADEVQKPINTDSKKELKRVLLVEDNIINKEVIELFLKSICALDHSLDGLESIEMAKKVQYDLILLDINLGRGIDGIEVAQEIRKLPGYEKTPMVAVTGYALAGDKKRILEAGMTHYVPKPFEMADFVDTIKKIL